MTTWETLRDLVDEFPARGDAPAVIAFDRDGPVDTSYRALSDKILRLATGLCRAGIQPGDRVLLVAPNSPEWIVSYFAIVCAGATAVPLDDQWSDKDVLRAADDSGARHAFAGQKHAPALAQSGSVASENLVVLNRDSKAGLGQAWESFFAERPEELPVLDPDGIASLLYTSGTTGIPKGVPLTHRNFLANLRGLLREKLAGPGDRVALPLPLHHAYPFTVGLLAALASGAVVLFPADLSGPALARAFRDGKATILIGVPRLYTALLTGIESRVNAHGAAARTAYRAALQASIALLRFCGIRAGRLIFRNLHREIGPGLRLLACGGAPLDPTVGRQLEGLGWKVLIGYGLTEAAPILTSNLPGQTRVDSAGFPLPGVEIRIEKGPDPSFGEILARGVNIFGGYRNNPDATRETLTDDGWLRTGDLGFVDRDGRLHIVGRLKEMIVLSGGKKVFPEAVEKIYKESPLIDDIAVIEDNGALTALVIPNSDEIRNRGAARAGAMLHEEIETISLRLPPYQRIGAYKSIHEKLPRTPLGKFQRHLLLPIYRRAARTEAEPPPSSDADDPVLASPRAREVWQWLQQRFPDRPLALDMSPQLDLQVDSLSWVSLTLEIQDRFGVALPQETIGQIVTLRDLVAQITAAVPTGGTEKPRKALEPAETVAERGPFLTALGTCLFAFNRLMMRWVFRLDVIGANRLPASGPLVIAPNHTSFLDPLAIAAALPRARLRETYWAGWIGIMFRGPIRRLLSRSTNVFPVDADHDPSGGVAIALSVLRRGRALVWFPEGRRSPNGEIQEFLPGIGVLAERAGAPVVPTLIRGTFEAWPSRRHVPRPRAIQVIFGVPMSAESLAGPADGKAAPVRIAAALRRAVATLAPTGTGGRTPD